MSALAERQDDFVARARRREDILVFAMRYAMQRVTAAPGIVADEIRTQMRGMTVETLRQICREIDVEVARQATRRESDMDVGTFTALRDDINSFLEHRLALGA